MRRALIAATVMAALAGCGQHGGIAPQPVAAVADAADEVTAPVEVPLPPEEQSEASHTATTVRAGRASPPSPEAPSKRLRRVPRPAPTDAPAPGIQLWDRTYASVEITQDGASRQPADGARLFINPFRREGKGQLRYNGGCNTGGASLRITASRFRLGNDGAASAMLCEPAERMDQEQWFTEFLDADPHWSASRDGSRLVLRNDTVTVTFEEHPWPPPWRADGHS